MACKYLTRREAKELRKPLSPIIMEVQKDIKEQKGIGFSPMIVGSAKRHMIIQKGYSEVDTDYQLNVLGKKSKDLLPSLKKDIYNSVSEASLNKIFGV